MKVREGVQLREETEVKGRQGGDERIVVWEVVGEVGEVGIQDE